MNPDIRTALADAEHALENADTNGAIACYLEAGDAAVSYQLWRSAARAFRSALELDVAARTPIQRLIGLGAHVRDVSSWIDYGIALDAHPTWPHFGVRRAQICMDDRGARIECRGVGAVLHIAMPAADRVVAIADPQLDGMPLAMALVILRRTMWPDAREQTRSPRRIQVLLGDTEVTLDELW